MGTVPKLIVEDGKVYTDSPIYLARTKPVEEYMELPDYDWAAYERDGGEQGNNGHYPDKYKTPHHITFSEESTEHGGQYLGGKWVYPNDSSWRYDSREPFFVPSQFNQEVYQPWDYAAYSDATGEKVLIPEYSPGGLFTPSRKRYHYKKGPKQTTEEKQSIFQRQAENARDWRLATQGRVQDKQALSDSYGEGLLGVAHRPTAEELERWQQRSDEITQQKRQAADEYRKNQEELKAKYIAQEETKERERVEAEQRAKEEERRKVIAQRNATRKSKGERKLENIESDQTLPSDHPYFTAYDQAKIDDIIKNKRYRVELSPYNLQSAQYNNLDTNFLQLQQELLDTDFKNAKFSRSTLRQPLPPGYFGNDDMTPYTYTKTDDGWYFPKASFKLIGEKRDDYGTIKFDEFLTLPEQKELEKQLTAFKNQNIYDTNPVGGRHPEFTISQYTPYEEKRESVPTGKTYTTRTPVYGTHEVTKTDPMGNIFVEVVQNDTPDYYINDVHQEYKTVTTKSDKERTMDEYMKSLPLDSSQINTYMRYKIYNQFPWYKHVDKQMMNKAIDNMTDQDLKNLVPFYDFKNKHMGKLRYDLKNFASTDPTQSYTAAYGGTVYKYHPRT